MTNSLPIKGRAILTEDEANVIRKEPKVATNKATLLFPVSFMKVSFTIIDKEGALIPRAKWRIKSQGNEVTKVLYYEKDSTTCTNKTRNFLPSWKMRRTMDILTWIG
jgi:hypothetical protein